MLLHDEVLGGIERAGLQQDGIWNADLADVVQVAASIQGQLLIVGKAQMGPNAVA